MDWKKPFAGIKKFRLPGWKTFFVIMLFLLLYLLSCLSSLRIFIPYYPALSGFPFQNKNYLVVFQNNHELRPGGGFITSYGMLKFSGGIFKGIEIADVYADPENVEFIEPPYPMAQLLASKKYKGYSFRDANYFADYPKSVEELKKMLQKARPDLKFDGVIAVNYSFLEDLLGAVGPVEIDNKTYSKESLFENLESEVNNIDRHNLDDLNNRKGVLKTLAQAILKKMVLSPLKLRRICDAVVENLNNKNIQLYFDNSSLQYLAALEKWDGKWPQNSNSDFMSVVEANLGGMKSDRYLKRDVQYRFIANENYGKDTFDLTGEVTINLQHYGIDNAPLSGEYNGYFRVYVPKGSKLLEVNEPYETGVTENDEGDYHVFGSIVKLKPGAKTTLIYKYSLPTNILSTNQYQLNILKQSGTDEDHYTAIFQAPQGYRISSSDFIPRENTAVFETQLKRDFSLSLAVLPDMTPPIVNYQLMDSLGVIDVGFNEVVSNVDDPLRYEITDLDIINPTKHDQIIIDKIERSGKNIRFFVKGMTDQPEERYGLTMRDISDMHGNDIDPNPKTITVVQRFNGE